MSNRIEPAPFDMPPHQHATNDQDLADAYQEIDDSDRFKDISHLIWMQNMNSYRKHFKDPASQKQANLDEYDSNRFSEKIESKICSIL